MYCIVFHWAEVDHAAGACLVSESGSEACLVWVLPCCLFAWLIDGGDLPCCALVGATPYRIPGCVGCARCAVLHERLVVVSRSSRKMACEGGIVKGSI